MTTPNPNWPLVSYNVDFTTGPPNVPGTAAMSINAASRRNAVRKCQTSRGRQYELDQVQSGTATLDITDPLENLNPANTGSPYNSAGNTITSYRCIQIGAFWNSATANTAGNLLNTANLIPGQPWLGGLGKTASYGYDPSFENPLSRSTAPTGGSSVVSGLPTSALNSNTGFETGISPWTAVNCTAVQSSTQKHSGSFSAKITPNGTSAAAQLYSEGITVVAGRQYTVTGWMWATAAVTSNALIQVSWYDSGSNLLSVASTTLTSLSATTWTQLTGTVTAPAGAVAAQFVPQVEGTPPATNILYFDDCSIVNTAAPADGTATVTALGLSSGTDLMRWRPRYTPGTTFVWTVDVWAASGLAVTLAWGGTNPASTAITGSGTYQTMTLTVTTTATDPPTAWNVYLQAPSAAAYPVTVYVANITVAGQVAGYLTTGSPTMKYTQANPSSGAYSLLCTTSASSDRITLPLSTVPGSVYTFSAYVQVVNTGSSLGVTQTILGSGVSTTVVGSYQRLVSTFTAIEAVTLVAWSATSNPYPAQFYLDAIQLELAATASAFTTSGPTFYPIYTGYVERFPLQWDMHGTRGIRPLTCVDALATLSRTEITQSYSATILANSPSSYTPLSDAALPQVVQLPQGGFPMVGYTSVGTSGQVSFAGDTFLDGNPAVSVSQQNANPPTSGNPDYITYLGTTNGGIPFNPTGFTLELWIKPTSGTMYLGAAAVEAGENPDGEALGPNQWIGWYTTAGQLTGQYTDSNGQHFFSGLPGWNGYPDGNWHYLAIVLTGNQFHFWVDGVAGGYGTMSGTPLTLSLNNLFVNANTYFGDPQTVVAVANVATYNAVLPDSALSGHYQRGIGYLGEVSGARVLRLLEIYWSNNVVVAAGSRAMAEDYTYSTRFMLDVLQEIQETERGLIYVDRYGIVTFDDSTSRYVNYPVSVAVFGENPAGASPVEYPYQDLVLDYDPTYTFSQTNLTRPDNENFLPLPNPLPTNPPYGQRILTQEVQITDDFDLVQISTFYLARYAGPVIRVDTLTLNLAANPALFAVVLGLEIGARITVKRRTSAGVNTSNDYYVEQIAHDIDGPGSAWTISLQCSPAYAANAWILGDSVYGVLGSTTIPVY